MEPSKAVKEYKEELVKSQKQNERLTVFFVPFHSIPPKIKNTHFLQSILNNNFLFLRGLRPSRDIA
jgi:hypothetical protein